MKYVRRKRNRAHTQGFVFCLSGPDTLRRPMLQLQEDIKTKPCPPSVVASVRQLRSEPAFWEWGFRQGCHSSFPGGGSHFHFALVEGEMEPWGIWPTWEQHRDICDVAPPDDGAIQVIDREPVRLHQGDPQKRLRIKNFYLTGLRMRSGFLSPSCESVKASDPVWRASRQCWLDWQWAAVSPTYSSRFLLRRQLVHNSPSSAHCSLTPAQPEGINNTVDEANLNKVRHFETSALKRVPVRDYLASSSSSVWRYCFALLVSGLLQLFSPETSNSLFWPF